MTKAFIPTIFEDEGVFLRPFFSEFKNCLPRVANSDVGVYEDEDAVTVEAPLPGLKADEIRVDLKEGVLYVQGERKEEKKEGKTHRKWSAKYSYSVLLPQPVDEKGKIEAEAKDGILTVRLPKSSALKPVKISVKDGSK